MTKAILVDDNFNRDTKFPEVLAKLAKLASAAAINQQQTFADPDDPKQQIDVAQLQAWDNKTKKNVTVPGVLVNHGGLLYEAWDAGLTRNNKEYYKFRIISPQIFDADANGNKLRPTLLGSGQIFINTDRVTRQVVYDMQVRPPALAARVEIAQALVAGGSTPEQASLVCQVDIADLADQPGPGRGAPVRLGWE